jgi:SsrA-binding protein
MAGTKQIANNRKAYHDYDLGDSFEAGLVLMGSEVKSLRDGHCNLRDGFVEERGGELWLLQADIPLYKHAKLWGHTDPRRPRKLLLHRQEILKLIAQLRERGMTIIPTKMYWKDGRAKVEIALAKGRRDYDKRGVTAERDVQRDIRRTLKNQDY